MLKKRIQNWEVSTAYGISEVWQRLCSPHRPRGGGHGVFDGVLQGNRCQAGQRRRPRRGGPGRPGALRCGGAEVPQTGARRAYGGHLSGGQHYGKGGGALSPSAHHRLRPRSGGKGRAPERVQYLRHLRAEYPLHRGAGGPPLRPGHRAASV